MADATDPFVRGITQLAETVQKLADREDALTEEIANLDARIERLRGGLEQRESRRQDALVELADVIKQTRALRDRFSGTGIGQMASSVTATGCNIKPHGNLRADYAMGQSNIVNTIERSHSVSTTAAKVAQAESNRAANPLDKTGDWWNRIYPVVHKDFATVIMLHGQATAISCHVCGANTKVKTNVYLHGVKGIQQHTNGCHKLKLSIDDVVRVFSRRTLSSTDAALIRDGEQPRHKIEKIFGHHEPHFDTTDAVEGQLFSSCGNDAKSQSRLFDTSTKSKEKRDPHVKVEFQVLHKDYPTVIVLEGQPMEVACNICGANASRNHPNSPANFLGGIRGIQLHMQTCHGVKGVSLVQVAVDCTKRLLSDLDARRIRHGKEPNHKIGMRVGRRDRSTKRTQNEALEEGHSSFTADISGMLSDADFDDGVPDANEIIHPDFPTVTFLDDYWYDISCKVCGANANPIKPSFFNGVLGLQQHLRRHTEYRGKGLKFKHYLAECNRRRVSTADINSMANGQQPAFKITMHFGLYGGEDAAMNDLEAGISGPALAGADEDLPTFPAKRQVSCNTATSDEPSETGGLKCGWGPNDARSTETPHQLTAYEEWQKVEAEAQTLGAALPVRRCNATSLAKKYAFGVNYSDDDVDYPLAKRRK